MENLTKHLIKFGKTDTWLNLAIQYNILPNASNKQRADKVRKLFNKLNKKNVPFIINNIQHKTKTEGNENNVLIIGDLHEPFCLDGYLEFCKKQQEKFNCGTIVFIGDIIDSHYSSYHESDPDGMSAGMELNKAINKLQKWYKAFPNAVVTIGNHDRIIARKLYTSGISARWMKPIQEVLNVPNWSFVEEFEHNNVLYIHGEGGTAKTKSKYEFISVVQGHNHTECYIDWSKGRHNQIFAMQVGTGINFDTYAFGYAQRGRKPMTSCGVVLNNVPILIPYE